VTRGPAGQVTIMLRVYSRSPTRLAVTGRVA
jgi:hypothetical protein